MRSPGINPEKFDLYWWLENLSRQEQYISDGNADTVAIPEGMEEYINKEALGQKELIVYSLE